MALGYSFSALFAMLLVILTGVRSKTIYVEGLEDEKFFRLSKYVAIYCALDALWGVFYAGALFSQIGFTIACYGAYLMAGVVTIYWVSYVIEYMGEDYRISLAIKTVAAILLIIQVMYLISNIYTHDIFFVNSEGTFYHFKGRDQLHILQALNFLLIFIYWVYRLVADISSKKNPRKNFYLGMVYFFMPAVFGIGQVFFVDISLYTFGLALAIYTMFIYEKSSKILHHLDKERRKEGREQLSIIKALAGDFSTIYSIDMETGGFVVYNRTGDESFLNKIDNSHLDYFRVAVEKGRHMVHDDDQEHFLMIMDRDVIKRRFETEQSFSVILRIHFGNTYRYIEYRFTYNHLGKKEQIIIGVYDVDKVQRRKLREAKLLETAREKQMALEEEAQMLEKAAFRDIMTGLYNRRAYEDYIDECKGMPEGEGFLYVSLDVNGLKAINDDQGHDAGDELITGAAFCMKKVLGEYGYIYRHGGDEFSAILHVPGDKRDALFKKFDNEVAGYRGRLVSEVSVSYGVVAKDETGDIPIEEMAKIADKRMYEAKNQHYARKGIDRRGQQEAYDAIRKSYIKILKVDLKTDTFASVYMDESESESDKGYDTRLSKWLHDFAAKGNVHPEDAEEFFNYLDYEKIKDHFKRGLEPIAIHYRRKSVEDYNNALLEIIPSEDFSEESQVVFLYVKNIH